MKIIVAGDEEQRITLGIAKDGVEVVWVEDMKAFNTYHDADAFLDLSFVYDKKRIDLLKTLLPKPVVVNSVIERLSEIDEGFTRINGWNTFLNASSVEGACLDPLQRERAEAILDCIGKKIEWVPDVAGFVSPRIISMIINEAFFALEEEVSTKEEINIAMKLGTNYPYGPFEWAEKIGIRNIYALLQSLSTDNSRYSPAPALVKAAMDQQSVK